MSARRSPSWASVVAHGIIDEPMQLLEAIEVLPSKAATPLSSPPPTPTPTPTPSASPTLTLMSTPTISPTLSPTRLPKSLDNDIDMDSPPYVKSSGEKTWFCSKNDSQSKSSFRRPLRNNWPRHPTPFPDHRHHHRSNNQGVFYRPRRHHYSSTHLHPRCPAPQNWQPRITRPMMKPHVAGFNNSAEPEKRHSSNYYPPKPLSIEEDTPIATAAQSMDLTCEWEQPSFESSQNDGGKESGSQEQSIFEIYDLEQSNRDDSQERQRVCVSPRARSRCQITFSDAISDLIQWQPISKSRRVWEPLDPNQRGSQDPSNPIPPPPPGFEHVVPGKRALSGRARKLMGEPVDVEEPKDYSTPEPMPMPERELREQQHFIAKHDTHLSCRQAQLRVTNGCTGDGYYVRPLAKLMPKLTKLSPPPKYQSSYQPNISYWELLRRNREHDELEAKNTTDGDYIKPRKYHENGTSHHKPHKREQRCITNVGSACSNNSKITIAKANLSANLSTNPTDFIDTTVINHLPNGESEQNNELDSSTADSPTK